MIYHGDCLEVLKGMEADSVDSMVTDPPYGWRFMGAAWDVFDISSAAEKRREDDKIRTYYDPRPGRQKHYKKKINRNSECAGLYDQSLKGNLAFQSWTEEWAREAYRVLKPGAHILVFCGPRTYHRMASGVEDAGFEVRDQMQWLFGSGFPKSLDVSKAIDKAAGAEREVTKEGQTKPLEYAGKFDNSTSTLRERRDNPSTPEAIQWQGFGTALKPANEPILLARKPLSEKTVAANVMKHGVGGLNIDGCRISGEAWKPHTATGLAKNKFFTDGEAAVIDKVPHNQGRFPANLIFSHNEDCVEVGTYECSKPVVFDRMRCSPNCAVAMLDEQSGECGGAPGIRNNGKSDNLCMSGQNLGHISSGYNEPKSGASRFFYCAKSSKSERNAGLATPSSHPTVKPLKLMSYLIRLVTPPGGIVLDPFAGSGSTGVAALQEGFRFIGIEKEQEYILIAEKRMEIAVQ